MVCKSLWHATLFWSAILCWFWDRGIWAGLQPEEVPGTDKKESVVAYWGVKEIYKEYDRFIESGAMEYEKPNEVGGDIIVATVKDPWGNIIGLIYNPHFKISW